MMTVMTIMTVKLTNNSECDVTWYSAAVRHRQQQQKARHAVGADVLVEKRRRSAFFRWIQQRRWRRRRRPVDGGQQSSDVDRISQLCGIAHGGPGWRRGRGCNADDDCTWRAWSEQSRRVDWPSSLVCYDHDKSFQTSVSQSHVVRAFCYYGHAYTRTSRRAGNLCA